MNNNPTNNLAQITGQFCGASSAGVTRRGLAERLFLSSPEKEVPGDLERVYLRRHPQV